MSMWAAKATTRGRGAKQRVTNQACNKAANQQAKKMKLNCLGHTIADMYV